MYDIIMSVMTLFLGMTRGCTSAEAPTLIRKTTADVIIPDRYVNFTDNLIRTEKQTMAAFNRLEKKAKNIKYTFIYILLSIMWDKSRTRKQYRKLRAIARVNWSPMSMI